MRRSVPFFGMGALLLTAVGVVYYTQDFAETQTDDSIPDILQVEPYLYSNIAGPESQDYISSSLTQAGISPQRSEQFFEQVMSFNSSIDSDKELIDGFIMRETDSSATYQTSNKVNQDYQYNDRISSFALLRDVITLTSPPLNAPDTSNLKLDYRALAQNPLFSPEELAVFEALYSHMPAADSDDPQDSISTIIRNREERAVQFSGDRTAPKLISVIELTDESMLTIGQSGILVATQDGRWLYLTKLGFDKPYESAIFESREAIVDYLMDSNRRQYGSDQAFVFENDSIMYSYERYL